MKSSASSTSNRRSLLMSTARVAPAEDDVLISSEEEGLTGSNLPGSKRNPTSISGSGSGSGKKKSSQRRLMTQADGDSDQEQDKPKLSLSSHVPSNRRFSTNSHNIKTSLMLSNHRRASAPVHANGSANGNGNGTMGQNISDDLDEVQKPSSKREQRRRSVLQSLAALDIDDDLNASIDNGLPPPSFPTGRTSSFDSDDGLLLEKASQSSRATNNAPSLASLPRRSAHNASSGEPPRPLPKRYLRRGGVTHTQKFDDNVTHNQPTAPNVSHGDDSDYGSDVGSTSRRHRPAATSTRYLRRGSVTKHFLNPQVGGMQPTATSQNVGDESDYGSDYDFINPNSMDIVSDAYISESGMDDDIYSNDEDDLRTALQKAQRNSAPPLTNNAKRGKKRQYLRRGSVTKYSLDSGNATTIQTDKQTSQAEQDAKYIAKSRLPPPPSNDDYSPRFAHANIVPSVASAAASAFSQDEDMDFYSTNLEDSKRPISSRSIQISSDEEEADCDLLESDTSDHEEYGKKMPAKVSRTKPRSKRHLKSAVPTSPKPELPPLARKKKASKALENDSGHVRKSWYKDPSSPSAKTTKPSSTTSTSSPNRSVNQESNSSMESSDPSESEFATEEAASSPQKQTISEDRNVGDSTPCSVKHRKSVKEETPPAKSSATSKKFPTISPPFSKTAGGKLSPPPKSTIDAGVNSKSGSGKPPPRTRSLTSKEKRASTGSSNVKAPPPITGNGKNDKGKASKLRSKSLDNLTPILPLLPKSCLKKASSKKSGLGSSLHSEPGAAKVAKKVRYGKLTITEFPIILGDNPAVTSGAPVTIDWTPQDQRTLSVTAYEQTKPRRRRRRKLLISVSQRAILLLAAGYTIDDIADASINAQQIKQSRQQAIDNQQWDRVNLMMEHTGGALGRLLQQPFQNTSKKLKALIVKPTQQTQSARMA